MTSTTAIRAGRAFVELFTDDTKLTRGLRAAEYKVRRFGRSMSAFGRTLLTTSVALAAPLALATRTFAGFDDQMRAVQAVSGATGQEFLSLTETAKELGRTTSYTAAQVAGAALELARAGFSANFFGVAGYEVTEGTGYADAAVALRDALASGAHIVVLCSSDEEYAGLTSLVADIKQQSPATLVVVAGNPATLPEQIKQTTVDRYIHLRTNALEALAWFNEKLGVATETNNTQADINL